MAYDTAAPADEAIQRRYEEALEAFVARVKEDRHLLAAILFGSLSYDEVWERSDIDLWLIARDEGTKESRDYCLVENGVNIHAYLCSRAEFRKRLERSLHGSFIHSSFARSRLLYTHDESIAAWFEDAARVGARDREAQLLRHAAALVLPLTKAQKWLHVKRDPAYSYVWILYVVNDLAAIEVLLHDEVPGREVVHQAMKLNPAFFGAIYADVIHVPKTEERVGEILCRINDYLDRKLSLLFKPLLEFLAEVGAPRTVTELNDHFKKRAQMEFVGLACEWLADKGVIEKVSAPLRLTQKSRVSVEEAAYYYDGGRF